MTPAADRFLAELLQLPAADRGELAARLVDSLDSGADEDAEAAWSEEIRSRIEDVRGGKAKPVPWAEARAQILADDDGGP